MRKETHYLKTKIILQTVKGFAEKAIAYYNGRVETQASTQEFAAGYKVAIRDVLMIVDRLIEENELEYGNGK